MKSKSIDPFDLVIALRDRLGNESPDTWLQRAAPRPKPDDPKAFDRVRRAYHERRRRPKSIGAAVSAELLPPLSARASSPQDQLVLQLLRGFQELLLEHPTVARRLFGALVAEGRRFADTDEGKAWAHGLSSSRAVQEARLAFQLVSVSMLEGTEEPEQLPSEYLDAFFRTAMHDDPDLLLDQLFGLGSHDPED